MFCCCFFPGWVAQSGELSVIPFGFTTFQLLAKSNALQCWKDLVDQTLENSSNVTDIHGVAFYSVFACTPWANKLSNRLNRSAKRKQDAAVSLFGNNFQWFCLLLTLKKISLNTCSSILIKNHFHFHFGNIALICKHFWFIFTSPGSSLETVYLCKFSSIMAYDISIFFDGHYQAVFILAMFDCGQQN